MSTSSCVYPQEALSNCLYNLYSYIKFKKDIDKIVYVSFLVNSAVLVRPIYILYKKGDFTVLFSLRSPSYSVRTQVCLSDNTLCLWTNFNFLMDMHVSYPSI